MKREKNINFLESIWNRFKNQLCLSMSKGNITKRIITYKHPDSSLTSKRVSIILSSPVDSKKVAAAVRALRQNEKVKASFKLTSKTKHIIEKERLKLQHA